MPRITNNTRGTLDFVIKGPAKDGVPPTDHIDGGETKNIDAVEDGTYRGYLIGGAISLAGADKATAEKK